MISDDHNERLTFLELLKPEFKERDLDFNKAALWFDKSPFVMDSLFLIKHDPKISRILYKEVLDLNISCSATKQKLENLPYPKEIKVILLECLSFFYRKTLFGMTKYSLETRTYQCEMKKDYGVYRMAWFHFVIMNELDTCFHKWLKGETGSLFALSVPPQHCKSTIVSGSLPALMLANKPDAEGLIVCYSEKYSEGVLKKNLYKVIKSKGYRFLFSQKSPLFTCHMNKQMKAMYKENGDKLPLDNSETIETTLGGRVFVCSATQATGNPGNFICLDDPIPSQESADSPSELKKIIKEIESSVETRMRSRSLMCIAQTRWHTRDPIGVILEKDAILKAQGDKDGLSVINICLRAEYDPTDDFQYDFRKYKGQLLWPDVCGRAYKLKQSGDPREYSALYQQRPLNDSGNIFLREWFNLYNPSDAPNAFIKLAISVDASFNDKKKSDKCAIEVWGITKQKEYYLLYTIYDQLTFTGAEKSIEKMINKYPNYTEILIEPKANGYGLIDVLRKKFSRIPDIEPPKESKRSRAISASPIVEGRQVYIPKNHMGTEFLDQMLDFKGVAESEKDDLVDAATQVFHYYDDLFKRSFSINDFTTVKTPEKAMNFQSQYYRENPLLNNLEDKYNAIVSRYKGFM